MSSATTLSGASPDMDQPSTSVSDCPGPESTGVSADQPQSSELFVYPWDDWVVLYLRNLRQIVDESVPTNER